jgi:hypothetical protein
VRAGRGVDKGYDKNFIFCCAGRLGILDSTFLSIIEENGKSKLKEMSRTGRERVKSAGMSP